jgi:hypothetical protein
MKIKSCIDTSDLLILLFIGEQQDSYLAACNFNVCTDIAPAMTIIM